MKFKCRACGQTIQITKRGAISIHKPPKEVAERYNIGRRKLCQLSGCYTDRDYAQMVIEVHNGETSERDKERLNDLGLY